MAGSKREMVWKSVVIASAVIAVGASVCAYQRSVEADSLRQQLARSSADAKQAHEQISALVAKLDATAKQISDDRQQVASAEQQAAAEQQKLAAAQQQIISETAQLQAASRPDLPIKLSFRHALLSQGEVAVMQNLSPQTLEVTLDVQSSSTGAHFRRVLVINPSQLAQFGPQEGWPFASGQVVTLSNPAYRPITLTVGG